MTVEDHHRSQRLTRLEHVIDLREDLHTGMMSLFVRRSELES